MKTPKHAHKLIVATAIEIAGAHFEAMATQNDWLRRMKAKYPGKKLSELQIIYIKLMTGTFLEQARATLAKMLNGPHSETLKAEILDALIKDNALNRGRARRPVVNR